MNGQRFLLVLLLTCALVAAGCGRPTTTTTTTTSTTAAGSGAAGGAGPGSGAAIQESGGATSAATGAPPARTLSTAYLAKEFQGVVVIHPQQIMKSDLYGLATKLMAQADAERSPENFFEERLGAVIDVRTIDEAVLAGGNLPGGGVPRPILGLTFRLNKPYDREAILEKIGANELIDVGAHKVYANDEAAVYFPDDKTIVVANVGFDSDPAAEVPGQINKPVDVLRSMLAPPSSTALTEALKTFDTSKDVAAIGVVDAQLRTQFGPQAQGFLQLFGLQKLAQANSVAVHIDASGETMLSVNIDVGDAQAAAELVMRGTELIRDFSKRESLQANVGETLPASGDSSADAIQLLVDFAAGHKLEAVGSSVVLKFSRPTDLTARIERIAAPLVAKAGKEAKLGKNLRYIGIALQNHHDLLNGLPAPAIMSADGKPLLSWRVAILPFLEQGPLYEEFKKDEPWDSEHNKKLISRMPAVFACGISPEEGKSNTLAIVGGESVWDFGSTGRLIPFGVVVDGLSNTAMVVQVAEDRAVPWTKPEDFQINADDVAAGLGLKDEETFVVLFCDASVHFLSKRTKTDTLKAIFTRAGEEPINLDDLK
ncbi:MAG: DUF1559 domain-containing protein [Planctomycetia bacterium]|nr:DUF1559 domain-containing protein [Planctomycetia bacterium]